MFIQKDMIVLLNERHHMTALLHLNHNQIYHLYYSSDMTDAAGGGGDDGMIIYCL